MRHTKRRKAEGFLLLATLIWGGTFVVIKGALTDISPLFFVGIRFLIATLIFTPFIMLRRDGFTRPAIHAGIMLGTIMFIAFGTQTIGLQYTTASKSGFITGLLVVFTPILQLLIERRVPRPGNILGVLLVLLGLYLLTSPQGSSFNIGDGLTLICAFFFGLYIVYIDIFTKKYSIMHLVYLQVLTVSFLSLFFALLFEPIKFEPTGNLLFALGYTTLLATMLNTFLQTKFQKETTPTRAGIIYTLEPVFSALLAFIVLNELIGMIGVLGGAIIVLGFVVSELSDLLERWGLRFGSKVETIEPTE
jgi:drug/metabolite transporter (DMT)-like permease